MLTHDPHRNPDEAPAPSKPIWPWIVGLGVLGGIGFGIWYGVTKVKQAAKDIGEKVLRPGVGEACPVLQWTFVSESQREDIAGDHQMTILVVRERGPSVISSAPITPAQARTEILLQLQEFTRDSRCSYTLSGDDPAQIVAGLDAQGEYLPS